MVQAAVTIFWALCCYFPSQHLPRFYGTTEMFLPLMKSTLSKVRCCITSSSDASTKILIQESIQEKKDNSVLLQGQKPLYLDVLGEEKTPLSLVGLISWKLGSRKLQALGQNFMLVCHQGRVCLWICEETGAQLEFELLHLVVMQVLLNQVAFSFKSCLHIRWDVWDHPRHEELNHKDHMLQRKNDSLRQ